MEFIETAETQYWQGFQHIQLFLAVSAKHTKFHFFTTLNQ